MKQRYDSLTSLTRLTAEEKKELEGLQFAIDQGIADSRRAIESAVKEAQKAIADGSLNAEQLAKTQLMISALDKIWPKLRQSDWQESVKKSKALYAKRVVSENSSENIPKDTHLSGSARHRRYVQGVQAAKRNYRKRADTGEQDKPKQSSLQQQRTSPRRVKTYPRSKREQINRIQDLISKVKEALVPINLEAAAANRSQYIKERESFLQNNISDLTQALVFLVSEHGSIGTIKEQTRRMFVFTDRLKDRSNELNEIIGLQYELDKQIKALLKQVELLPSAVDEAIYQVNAPYLSAHPEVRQVIIEEILTRAKESGVAIPETIFREAKSDDEFFRIVEEVTKSLPGQAASAIKKA